LLIAPLIAALLAHVINLSGEFPRGIEAGVDCEVSKINFAADFCAAESRCLLAMGLPSARWASPRWGLAFVPGASFPRAPCLPHLLSRWPDPWVLGRYIAVTGIRGNSLGSVERSCVRHCVIFTQYTPGLRQLAIRREGSRTLTSLVPLSVDGVDCVLPLNTDHIPKQLSGLIVVAHDQPPCVLPHERSIEIAANRDPLGKLWAIGL
jgi:hypothetical protein